MDIVASILGGLVSGLFTFLGVLITILYQRKKDKADLAEKEREERVLRFKERPRLEIVEYSGEKLYEEEQDVDLGFIVCSIRKFQNEGRPCFYYDEDIKDPSKWVYAEYEFKNTGATEISSIYFSTNLYRNTSIFNTSIQQNVFSYNQKLLNYSVSLRKSVKSGQTIRIRSYFVSNKIVGSSLGNPLVSVWLVDEYGKMWHQDLDTPLNRISDSKLTTQKEFIAYTDENVGIECFIDPRKW